MTAPIDRRAFTILEAADAAVSWWREHKPIGWGIAKHLASPTVNCVTFREKRLARAAARWYAACHPEKTETVDEAVKS